MSALTEDQKQMLSRTFSVDLDSLGEENYSVYHLDNYQGGPVFIDVEGGGRIFSTEMGGRLICLVIHEGRKVIKTEGCKLEDGF
jgi:hypothetical protein